MQPNNCPDCGSKLGKDAYKCRCGWKSAKGALETPLLHIDCCFVGCGIPALVRVFTKTGWANVCTEHYVQIERVPYVQQSPCIDEMKKAIAGHRARRDEPVAEREPGADDEALAA